MKLTDLFIKCLENEGVEYIFGIVGTETLDLADSLSKSTQIQYVNVRHEQGAAFMADIYGRLTKKRVSAYQPLVREQPISLQVSPVHSSTILHWSL